MRDMLSLSPDGFILGPRDCHAKSSVGIGHSVAQLDPGGLAVDIARHACPGRACHDVILTGVRSILFTARPSQPKKALRDPGHLPKGISISYRAEVTW